MKKKREILFPFGDEMRLRLRKMKLTVLLTFLVIATFGSGFSQVTLSLQFNQAKIQDVLGSIEKKTDYIFMYKDDIFNDSKSISVDFKDAKFEEVLKSICEQGNVDYEVRERQIILKEKADIRMPSILQQPQKREISGKVTDSKGQTLPGVSVVVKGTTTGTITDNDGKFMLSVPLDAQTLTFSFVGMKTQEISMAGKTLLNVILAEETIGIEEVVAIGYGTMKKSDLTGSIVSVKAKEMTNTPVTNALEALQGKVSGLDITRSSGQAGASMNFTIRGNRSLNASNTPLILVDGIQYGSYIDINPNDIESVEVLKDASSTAIYGSRGANGVIIITTKQGRSGKTKVEFNNYFGINQLTDYQKVGNTDQYVAMTREAFRNAGQWSSPADDATIFAGSYNNIKKGINTDWPALMLHNGTIQNNHIAISGGNEKTTFRLTTEYFNEHGLLKHDELNRFIQHLNLDHKISDKLKVGTKLVFNYSTQERRNTSFWNLIKLLPLGTPYNEDGTIMVNPWPSSIDVNPLMDESKDNYSNNTTSSRIFMVGYGDWSIMKNLSFHTNFAFDLNNSQQGIFEGKKSTQATSNNGYSHSSMLDLNSRSWTWENVLNYTKEFGSHSVNAMLGSSLISNRAVSFSAEGRNQPFESASFYNLNTNTLNIKTYSNLIESQLSSFFGRLNYKFKDRYLVTMSLRGDGSSVLAKGNKWAYFPSTALAWKAKDESFMSGINWLSDLKIRTSYGISGNSAIQPYQTQGGVSKLNFAFDETPAFGYIPTSIANKELGWEKTATFDTGIDFGLFNNRIIGSVDVYQTKTSDLLMQSILPALTGFNSIIANIGKTKTNGVDILLSSRNISTPKFTWTTDFNFSTVKEEIVELSVGGDDVSKAWFVGHPINVLYDYEKIGIWQTSEATEAAKYGKKPGEIKIKDQNKDGLITAAKDRIILGQASPKWTAGLNNNFTYKNCSLSVLLYARIGQMIASDYLGFYYTGGIFNTAVVDYWTPENPTNAYPRPNKANDQYLSTLRYIDGSFLKIKDIRFSYNFSHKDFSRMPVHSITLYGTAKNFFTFSKIKDYDPERGGSVDFPLTKQLVFGINIEL